MMLLGGAATAEPSRGRVIDAKGKPVARANVAIEGTTQGATTAADGTFVIDAPPGASLLISRAGYGVALATASERIADITLLAETSGETIEVEGAAPTAAQGAVRLDRDTVKRIAGTGNDLVRSMSALPGVASHPFPLGRSGVVIRGSAPHDSKFLVDDFEVPSIYHDLGFRSVIPVEAIDSLEYIPGGFDVSYGRATSGIASLTTRGGGEHAGQHLELSAGETGALAQGPTEHGRYTIAIRRSVIDLLLPALLPDNLDLSLATVPRYYDGQIRVDRELSKAWSVRLSSVGSDDVLEVYGSKQLDPDKRLFNRRRFIRATAALRYRDGPWSGSLAASGIAQQMVVERGQYQHVDVTSPALTLRGEVTRTAERALGLRDIAWKAGGELVGTHYTLDVAWPFEEEAADEMDTSQSFLGKVTTKNAAAWTAVGANLDSRVRLTGGVRVDAYTRNHDVAVQPRGELAVKLRPALLARFSAGMYSRPPEHDGELLDPSLRGERSTQLIAGLAYHTRGTRLQGSLYYTDRSQLIAKAEDAMLANTGTGTSMGAELLATVERGRWFGWFAYSYSRSHRIDRPGEAERVFDFDQPHDLNIAGSYRLGRWQLAARFRLVSGMPSTPVRAAFFDSDRNLYVPVFGDAGSVRAPMHHQLDLRFDKSFRWGPLRMTKFIDIQNVYLNDSVIGYYYNFDYSQRGAFRMLPIIPTTGIRGEL